MGAIDTLGDMGQNLDPENIFNLFNNPAFTKVIFFGKLFFTVALFFLGGALLWKYVLQYKYRITIKSQLSGGGLEVKHDRAKLVVDDQNKKKLQLLRLRKDKQAITVPIPSNKFKAKIGRSDHFEFWIDDNFQLHSIEPPKATTNKACLEIRPQERDAWARYEDKALRARFEKKDWIKEYLPSGILIVAMITAFLIWFFAAKQLGAGMTALATQFAQISSSCLSMGV